LKKKTVPAKFLWNLYHFSLYDEVYEYIGIVNDPVYILLNIYLVINVNATEKQRFCKSFRQNPSPPGV